MRNRGWFAAACSAVALVSVWWWVCRPAVYRPYTAAVDILPLWLGAQALILGRDPQDTAFAAELFRVEGLRMRVGGFFNHYPPTASLLFLPLRIWGVSFREFVTPLRTVLVLALTLGVGLSAAAGVRRSRTSWVVAGFCGLAALGLLTRPARIVIPTGQISPLLLAACGLGLFALARGKSGALGATVAAGAALKLAPLALLPAIAVSRDRRAFIVAFFVSVLVLGALLATGASFSPMRWIAGVAEFVDRPLSGLRAERGGALAAALWSWRAWLTMPIFALSVALAWRRPPSPHLSTAVGALGLAVVGLVAAGSPQEHEALLLLAPAAFVLVWPADSPRSPLAWATFLFVLLGAGAQEPLAMEVVPESLRWTVIGWWVFAGALARVCSALASRHPANR